MARRLFGRTRGFAVLALALARVPLWLATAPRSVGARRHEQAFFSRIARGFGIRMETRGDNRRAPATLYIMNHISWADIPVMMALLDADFVAKADMRGWPVIGTLARRFDPVFVARERRQGSHAQAEAIRSRLRSGRSVVLCPEGTTSDGSSVLPFLTSLFAAADAANMIQPVALSYLEPDGSVLTPQSRRAVAWIDDDELLAGAAQVARAETLALVQFLAPVAAGGLDRKALAALVYQRIADAHAAAPNLPR